jgi:hypothetical protein
MLNFCGVTSDGHDWGVNEGDWYDQECQRAEVTVHINTEDERQLILSAGIEFKLGPKAKGQVLMAPVLYFGLLKNDRIEPSKCLPDTQQFATATLPLEVTFWRQVFDHKGRPLNRVLHRNPLLSGRLGIGVMHLCIDLLHTVHLGVYATFLKAVCWSAIEADAFQIGGAQSEVLEMSVRRLLADMQGYYKAHSIPANQQIRKLTSNMLGSFTRPDFKAKASESGTLIGWAADFADRVKHRLCNGHALSEAGKILVQWKEVQTNAGPTLSAEELRNAVQLAVRHCVIMQHIGQGLLPKHHLWIHLNHHSKINGACRGHSTFLDESLNSTLSACCQSAHKSTWEQSVFERIRLQPLCRTKGGKLFSNF